MKYFTESRNQINESTIEGFYKSDEKDWIRLKQFQIWPSDGSKFVAGGVKHSWLLSTKCESLNTLAVSGGQLVSIFRLHIYNNNNDTAKT